MRSFEEDDEEKEKSDDQFIKHGEMENDGGNDEEIRQRQQHNTPHDAMHKASSLSPDTKSPLDLRHHHDANGSVQQHPMMNEYHDPWSVAVETRGEGGDLVVENEDAYDESSLTPPEPAGTASSNNGGLVPPEEEETHLETDETSSSPMATKAQTYYVPDPSTATFPPLYSPLSDKEKVLKEEAAEDHESGDQPGSGEGESTAVAETVLSDNNGISSEGPASTMSIPKSYQEGEKQEITSSSRSNVDSAVAGQEGAQSPPAQGDIDQDKPVVQTPSSPLRQTLSTTDSLHSPSQTKGVSISRESPRSMTGQLAPSTPPRVPRHHTLSTGFSPSSPTSRHRSVSFGGQLPHYSPTSRHRSPSMGEYHTGSFSPMQHRHQSMMASHSSPKRHDSLYFGSLSSNVVEESHLSEEHEDQETEKPTISKAEMMLEEKVMAGDTSVAAPTALAMLSKIDGDSKKSNRSILQVRKDKNSHAKKIDKEELKPKEESENLADISQKEKSPKIEKSMPKPSTPVTALKSKEEESSPAEALESTETEGKDVAKSSPPPTITTKEEISDVEELPTEKDSTKPETDDELLVGKKKKSEKKRKKKKEEKKRVCVPYVRVPDKRHVRNYVPVASIEEDASIHKQPSITGANGESGAAGDSSEELGKNINDKEVSETMRALSLPHNQYEVVLRRRAVRKKIPGAPPRKPIVQAENSDLRSKEALPREMPQQPQHQRSWRNLFLHSKSFEELKAKEAAERKAAKTLDTQHYDEEIDGDVSLGMKLTIIGGRVIIQGLIPLSDGRASPAQLAGRIERGDVLLSIDGNSLVHLPVDKFAEGLKPLSSPTDNVSDSGIDPLYKRELRLRFGIGEGLQLLSRYERQQERTAASAVDADGRGSNAAKTGALSHLVDQHSGMPLFRDDVLVPVAKVTPVEDVTTVESKPQFATQLQPPPSLDGVPLHKLRLFLFHQQISFQVALEQQRDRLWYTSGFYTLNEHFSSILRTATILCIKHVENEEKRMTHSELMERGRLALRGAKLICGIIEAGDKDKPRGGGRDAISVASIGRGGCSVSTWHSRASRKRRYMENLTESSDESEGGEDDSYSSGEPGDTGDLLLIQLAAHDVLWRKELVRCLQEALVENEEEEEKCEQPQAGVSGHNPVSPFEEKAQTELENIFFGRQVSKILSKKKTFALPPEDITSLLYDLSTRIAMFISPFRGLGAPGESPTLIGSVLPPRSSQDMALSFRFLFGEALPLWLKTFKPLPWEQRHALWPLAQGSPALSDQHSIGSSSRFDDGMSLSITSATLPWGSTANTKKKLAEQIQDLELDPHVRGDTCYLATLYFTHKLVPGMKSNRRNQYHRSVISEVPLTEADIVGYIKTFGAYLNIYTCLVSAADTNAVLVIKTLLEMAKYDPRHRQAMKSLSRANVLHLYEPFLLSALLESLPLFSQADQRQQQDALSLLVNAYPDLKPWQVKSFSVVDIPSKNGMITNEHVAQPKKAGRASGSKETHSKGNNFYYNYLSLLLHPEEGHDSARRDAVLVQEWCVLSTSKINGACSPERLSHFRAVASKENETWILYHRDLPMLLNLSMQISDYNIATELAGEVITDPVHCSDPNVLSDTLSHLRTIAGASLENVDESFSLDSSFSQPFDATLLRRIILIFHMMAMSKSAVCRESINIPDELGILLEGCRDDQEEVAVIPTEKEEAFVHIIAETAAPSDVLLALTRWKNSALASSILIPSLHTTLTWGARGGLKSELSGALLRIRRAREEGNNTALAEMRFGWGLGDRELHHSRFTDGGIWQSLLRGNVQIDK